MSTLTHCTIPPAFASIFFLSDGKLDYATRYSFLSKASIHIPLSNVSWERLQEVGKLRGAAPGSPEVEQLEWKGGVAPGRTRDKAFL